MKRKTWLKLLVGAACIAALLYKVDWAGTLDALRRTDPWAYLLAVLTLGVGIPISAFKWRLLLTARGVEAGLGECSRAYWVGSFFSNFLPSNVGGDVIRLIHVRQRAPVATLAASILIERLTGLATLMVLAAFSLLLRPDFFGPPGLVTLLVLAVGAIAVGLILLAGVALLFPGWARPPDPGVAASLPGRLWARLHPVLEAVIAYRTHPRALLAAMLLSVLFYGVLMVFQHLLFVAVGRPLPFATTILVAPMIPVVGLLPLTPNGLGFIEGAFVLFYVHAGADPETALAAAVLRRIATLLVSLIGGGLWMLTRSDYPMPKSGSPLR